MKIKNGFVLRQVCGDDVIVGEGLGAINFGKLLALNETAAWLWKQAQAQGVFTIDSLVEELIEEYDVEVDEARRDIDEILTEWQKIGVVE